jgi:YVTN family beta-propeller protein
MQRKRRFVLCLTAPLFLLLSVPLCLCGSNPGRPEPHRSPCDLAALPDGRRVLTANQGADSVSLVDVTAGRVLAELRCGRRPSAVAVSRDGQRAAVSNLWSGTVTILEVGDESLKAVGEVEVGPLPRGLAFAGEMLYAAVAGADEVVCIDGRSAKVVRRWPAPREPHHLAVSADGRWLAAASTRSAQVRLWDTTTSKLAWEDAVGDAFNLRGLAFTPDGSGVVCAHTVRRSFPVSQHNIEEGWVIDSRLTRLPIKADTRAYSQIALDQRGLAVGDPDGVAFGRDTLAVSGSGTHELLLFEAAHVPWSASSPGDFIDVRLEIGQHKMRRVELGGRPLTVAPVGAGDDVAVANSLLDAVQVVDVRAGKVTKTIRVGGPAEPAPARQGEALFYDARRSHNQWFSCSTCHSDGHTCGLNFDTLNDDSYGNPKLTPTLRGVTKTAPWTWHGWQKDLGAAVTKSFTETMFGPKPSDGDVKAMLAYLATLEQPPNPHRKDEAAKRGETLFRGKAACARCHKGAEFTSEGVYDVGLEDDNSPYDKWNPPSLRGLWDRGPYLHDGRAETLDELLQTHHRPQKLGGEELAPAERKDLIAFLKSL